ncbi:hypothetical protein ACU8MP_30215 (plasmid) [Rhizobium leguminosarum]
MTIPTSWPTCVSSISRIQARQTELGTELLVFTATGVRIKPDAFVCDLSELANPDSEGALEKLRRLVGILRQDFLAVLADQSVGGRLISDWPVPDWFEWGPTACGIIGENYISIPFVFRAHGRMRSACLEKHSTSSLKPLTWAKVHSDPLCLPAPPSWMMS